MELTRDRLRDLLRERTVRHLPLENRREAAVLVPLMWIGDEPHLIFNLRTETVPHHRGQIAFPGGRRDPTDPDLVFTALREAHEEIGVVPDDVEVLGRLDDYHTGGSLHHLVPIVGAITHSPYAFLANAAEVADIYEIPLKHLAHDANLITHTVMREGQTFETPGYLWEGKVIWGATAAILRDFLALVSPLL